jgi:hypothetical protein
MRRWNTLWKHPAGINRAYTAIAGTGTGTGTQTHNGKCTIMTGLIDRVDHADFVSKELLGDSGQSPAPSLNR